MPQRKYYELNFRANRFGEGKINDHLLNAHFVFFSELRDIHTQKGQLKWNAEIEISESVVALMTPMKNHLQKVTMGRQHCTARNNQVHYKIRLRASNVLTKIVVDVSFWSRMLPNQCFHPCCLNEWLHSLFNITMRIFHQHLNVNLYNWDQFVSTLWFVSSLNDKVIASTCNILLLLYYYSFFLVKARSLLMCEWSKYEEKLLFFAQRCHNGAFYRRIHSHAPS